MERTALKSSVDSYAAATAADRPGGVTVVKKPAINTASATSAMQDQDVGVIDTRLDEMHALIQASGGGIPITQQFSTDDLLYLVSMFEEDENIISSSSTM